ncbi:MAG: formate dehydrogenase subunit gamma [Pseudomonadales bacterium]|nr:formate dehydrogenase subunit gamma [Pseudomonadales bacterium]
MDSATIDSTTKDVLDALKSVPGALLPILHQLQEKLGCIPAEAVPNIALALNLSRAEVHGVISFYDHFKGAPAGKHAVKICRAEACQAQGSVALERQIKEQLKIGFGETSADNSITLEPVYCLGNCACGPSIQIDEQVYGKMDGAGFQNLIQKLNTSVSKQTPVQTPTAQSNLTPKKTIKIYVADDTSACALGADAVAEAITQEATEHNLNIELLRYGSRGLFWLEPLVEVETPQGRVAFGPVQVGDVAQLFQDGFYTGAQNSPLSLGLTQEIAYLKNQQRINFSRAGLVSPESLNDYKNTGGFVALAKVLTMSAQSIVDEVKISGLRGRGGAAFPTGIKWQTVLDAKICNSSNALTEKKYVVCNADEGDSGTFADRLLMEADPFALIEGMIIAGLATQATQGYIYLRSEYPKAHQKLNTAIAAAYQGGYLGSSIAGSEQCFELEVRLGAGSYICGEETALLDSLEGKRGMVRVKPPLPAINGLFGQPTVINNVLTLASVPAILARGAPAYNSLGCGRSLGTLPMQLAGNIKRGGLVELAFGTSLRELIEEYGGGTASGRPIKAVQVGGPLGAYLPESQLDIKLDYESFSGLGLMLGHGGVVVFDDSVNMSEQARFAMEFCAIESCGKCTPCRIGSTRGVEVIDKICSGDAQQRDNNLILLQDLCDTMEHGSLCAMGGLTPAPVRSALQHFPEDFGFTQPHGHAQPYEGTK